MHTVVTVGNCVLLSRRMHTNTVSIGVLAHPLDWFSRLDCFTTRKMWTPIDTSKESSRRDLSKIPLFDIDTLLFVEQSSLESQSRGCAKTLQVPITPPASPLRFMKTPPAPRACAASTAAPVPAPEHWAAECLPRQWFHLPPTSCRGCHCRCRHPRSF